MRRELAERVAAWCALHEDRRQAEDEPDRLRAYHPGDPPRSIHWRASAHAGSLLVCQRQSVGARRLAVLIDGTPLPSDRHGRLHELLICAAAATVEHLGALGWQVSVHGHGLPGGSCAPGQALDGLALAVPAAGDPLALAPTGVPALLLAHHPPAVVPEGILVIAGPELRHGFRFARRSW